jgi:sulfatase modifying factor 1
MPPCVNPACSREICLGALFCDYCQAPGRALGSDPDPWLTGVRLVGKTLKDRYFIEAVLRADETGLLYAARDTFTGEDLGLRLLPRRIGSSPERLQALEEAIQATRGLSHVNLVSCREMDAEGAEVVLLFPRAEGESVARYLDRRMIERGMPGLPPEEALVILEGVADGLDALHRRNLVHRGLRPAVVILTHEGGIIVPQITEIGVAALLRAFLSRLGRPEHFPFPYTSPEEIKGRPVSRHWDLFALGCLAWELLIGRTPFPGVDRFQKVLSGMPDGVNYLDEPLRAVLSRALDPDPQDRWPSSRPFVEALARVLPRIPNRPPLRFLASARGQPKMPDIEERPAPRRQSSWGALVALLVLTGGLITYSLSGSWRAAAPHTSRVEPTTPLSFFIYASPSAGPFGETASASASPVAVRSVVPSPVKSSPSPALASPSPRPSASASKSPAPSPSAVASAVPSPAVLPSASAAFGGLVPLSRNAQGYLEFLNPLDGGRMVLVPRGLFWMGSKDVPEAGILHEVWLSSYLIDKTECTVAQYKQYLTRTGKPVPAFLKGQADQEPVGGLSWPMAKDYLTAVGKQFPTEAQWEKAALGSVSGATYPWGEDPPTGKACFGLPLDTGKPRPVGGFAPNGHGLHDMAGNVWEWCLDSYDPDSYSNLPSREPLAQAKGEFKVIRGGSFADTPPFLRVAARNRLRASIQNLRVVGFRGVMPWQGKEP